jgi:hypothetical protein
MLRAAWNSSRASAFCIAISYEKKTNDDELPLYHLFVRSPHHPSPNKGGAQRAARVAEGGRRQRLTSALLCQSTGACAISFSFWFGFTRCVQVADFGLSLKMTSDYYVVDDEQTAAQTYYNGEQVFVLSISFAIVWLR